MIVSHHFASMINAELGDAVIEFVRTHEIWAAPIVFGLAFLESFAFLSLLVPATVILFGISGLLGAASVEFWPIYTAGVLGAFVGDWFAFELALYFKEGVARLWPISKHPRLLHNGRLLIERWGLLMVFLGRFFGPLRAAVPLVAGAMGMSRLKFQLANIGSALVWAAGILGPGVVGIRWLIG